MSNDPEYKAAINLLENRIKQNTLHSNDIELALQLSSNSHAFVPLIIDAFTANNITEAAQITQAALQYYPNCYDLLNMMGIILKKQKCFEEAINVLLKATSANPKAEHAWVNMGNIYALIEKLEEAINCFNKVLELNPNHVEAMRTKASIYAKSGNSHKEIELLTRAVNIENNNIQIILDLCAAYFSSMKYKEMLCLIEQKLKIHPSNIDLLKRKALALINYGKEEDSITVFENVLQCNPLDAETISNLIILYPKHSKDGHQKIVIMLANALIMDPNNSSIVLDLCAALYNNGNYKETIEYVEKNLNIWPTNTSLLKRKAYSLTQLGMEREAVTILEKALQYDPNDAEAIHSLGLSYLNLNHDYSKCKACYEWVYKLDPNNPDFILELCSVLSFEQARGKDLDRAHQLAHCLMDKCPTRLDIAEIIQKIALKTMDYPLYAKVGSFNYITTYWAENNINTSLLYQMSQVKSKKDRYFLLEAHRTWGTALENKIKPNYIIRKVKQRLNNKTRLGILSMGLKNSNVGKFVWPLLRYLDKNEFELYCYATDARDYESVDENAIRHSDHFQIFDGRGSNISAQSIIDDGIDILIDISIWTNNALAKLVAHHPADMQVSWLDYPHSLGLPTSIDYIITDPYIKPDDPSSLIEKQLMMPHTWISTCSELFTQFNIGSSLPEERNGFITFGTMNSVHKLNVINLKTWAEIMHKFPNSKFLYVRPETSSSILQQNFYKYMKEFGIDNNRISFVSTKTDHLKYYNEIDIAFDTFPHTGGTTTCEALWMGVPVISLVGPMFFERISHSNLNNCGLGDLCAFDIEQYKSIAISLAYNKERRSYLRHNLRQQIIQHPLGQPHQFATDFGNMLLSIWGK